MDLPKYIHGQQEGLPKTLASRVSFLRNKRCLHIAELSHQARVPLELLEDIEAGIDRWLPTSIRQRIARVLKVDPNILEEVEIKDSNLNFETVISQKSIKKIQDEILFSMKEIKCPLCNSLMRTWIQEGFDLNGVPIKSAKGHCKICVFQLRS